MGTRFARRLAASFALVGLAGAVLTAVLVNLAFSSRFDAYLAEQRTIREDALIVVLASAYGRTGSWDDDRLAAVTPTLVMAGSQVTVRDAAGRQVWSLADEQVGPEELAVHRAMMGTGPLAGLRSRPVVLAGQTVGSADLSVPVGALPAADQALRDSVNRLLAAGSLAAGVAALIVGVAVARRTARPVGDLTSAATAWTDGERTARVPVRRTDELGQLATTFNALADTVAREDVVRSQFTASIAHELRTPLAVLRSQLEGAQDGVVATDDRLLGSLHDESLRLTRLVEDLETLTAADAAGFTLRLEPVRLDLLIERALDAAAPRLRDQGLRVWTSFEAVVIRGDEARLRQVLDNLLGNALKYVPAGGTVSVHLSAQGRGAVIEIGDDGPGFDGGGGNEVFTRFVRGRDVTASGSGIGLAVVAELVRAHGGTCRAGTSPLGGALVTLRLPGPGCAPRSGSGRTRAQLASGVAPPSGGRAHLIAAAPPDPPAQGVP